MSLRPLTKTTMETNNITFETKVVTVFLDEPQARQFVEFQQHYNTVSILIANKVFEQKGAAITLHFDKDGKLRNITRADVLYDHRYNFTNLN